MLGLGLGGYWGHSEAVETNDLWESSQYFLPTTAASDFARLQFRHSDADHARQAVLFQIHLLEQLEEVDKGFRTNLRGELGWAYTRLAMIEESAAHGEARAEALAKAKECLKQSYPGAGEWTEDKMKDVVNRMDQLAGPGRP
jgi:hypothetical protein